MRLAPCQVWLLAGLCLSGSLNAANYYVSPSGSSRASGSISQPMDLQSALNGFPRPGDTVWLRGGTYNGNFTCWTSGSTSQPVVFRQYPGERATINGGSSQNPALMLQCKNVWFWGFEIYFSDTKRISSQTDSFPTDIHRGTGVASAQTAGVPLNIKLINMVVHDTWGSFGIWKDATTAEVYGNIVYYDGWDAPDRGHGHGIYSQNTSASTKKIFDNIMFSAFSHGLHIYSTSDLLQSYDIEGNVAFDNGALSETSGYAGNFLIGESDYGPKNITFKNNYAYYSPRKSGGEGGTFGSDAGCSNVSVTSNIFAAQNGTALSINSNCVNRGLSLTGNTVIGKLSGFKSSQYSSNTYRSTPPGGTQVFVRPNKYESGRGHVIIYNWDKKTTVSVSLSSILKAGDHFQIRDSQHFYGSPVLSGVYDGGTVGIPMTNTSMAPIVGTVPLAPVHTSVEFGAFVVLKQ